MIVTMKFSDTLIANLIASRLIGPPQKRLKLYSKKNCLTVAEDQFILADNLGNLTEESKYTYDQAESITQMLENFAQSILSPDKNPSFLQPIVDLDNMAIIESAYLSAKTAMPEEPARILNMANIEQADI